MGLVAKVSNNATSLVVKSSNTSAILSQTSRAVTLKNAIQQDITLNEITDVIAAAPTDGDTLVYNSTLNKYEVKAITSTITGLDGGLF
jgi:hypothetical protein